MASTAIKRPKINYQTLNHKLVGKTVDCIGKSFSESRDPFTLALGLTATQWGILSHMFVQRAAKKELSIVAIDPEKDRVEGVIINEDWKESPPDLYRSLEDWAPVRAIFNELHTRFKAEHPRIDYGHVLHTLYFTCVRPESRGRGIVSDLWDRTVEIARASNYATMVAEGSAPATEKVLWGKMGFRIVTQVPFAEFKFHGNKLFADLPKQGFEKLAIYQKSIPSNLFV